MVLTELQVSVAVKTASVIPVVLDHRCYPANSSYAKLSKHSPKLVSLIYESEGLFCVTLCHGQYKYYL